MRRPRTVHVVIAAGTLYVLGVTIGLPLLALGSGSINNPDTTICPLTPTAAADSGSPTILGPQRRPSATSLGGWTTPGGASRPS